MHTTKSPDFQSLWKTCVLDKHRAPDIKRACDKIKTRIHDYKEVEKLTGVPWKLIAGLHYRESSLNFLACLHNGQPWNKVTTWVPKGRGPWVSWKDAAVDALKLDGLHLIKFTDVPSMLVMAEKFNGMGYRKTGELSPYVWAGTNHHDETGKYVSDGKYKADAKEDQLGVAAIIRGLDDVA